MHYKSQLVFLRIDSASLREVGCSKISLVTRRVCLKAESRLILILFVFTSSPLLLDAGRF